MSVLLFWGDRDVRGGTESISTFNSLLLNLPVQYSTVETWCSDTRLDLREK